MSKSSRRRIRQRQRKIDEKRDGTAGQAPVETAAVDRRNSAAQKKSGDPTPKRSAPPRTSGTTARQDLARLQQQQVEVQSYSETYSGPVPPPNMLREYDYLVPGAAQKIIDAAVGQTFHRQTQEAKVIAGSEARANRGQLFGFVLLLVGMAFGLIIALSVDAKTGGVVIGAALASGAIVYVVGGRPPKGDDHPTRAPQADSAE